MSGTRPCDSCRICRCSFKVKFGSLTGKQFYSLSQNLFKPSQRKDSFETVLADVCRQVGLVLYQDPGVYSDRVCNTYGRKILSIFPLPSPSPSSILKPSSSPLESFVASPQPSVGFIIQDGGISDSVHRSPRIFIARPAEYACTAGYTYEPGI